jgi:hypothetical protein
MKFIPPKCLSQALLSIRDERLYRADYSTFEEYCDKHWGMKRAHANRLISAVGVIDNLDLIGSKPNPKPNPKPAP